MIPENPPGPAGTHGNEPHTATAVASRIAAIGIAMAGIVPRPSAAEGAPSGDPAPADPVSTLPPIEVTGTATALSHEIPQSIDTVGEEEMQEQAATRIEDVLRNVPGITLNAGEGGAHGDSVNLRGLSVPDSFFLDGMRDIGPYRRDTFNEDTVELLLGPSSVLFGRGSTAGVINQVSKEPLTSPRASASLEFGTADYSRASADLNWVLGDHAAARLNLMDERSGVAGRDDVLNRRSGIAPAVSFGINEPTSLTLSLLHLDENDVPDYGIPFIDGAPARVNRHNDYGLVGYDRTKAAVNVATARLEHRFNSHFTLTDSLRYGHYDFTYLLSAPHLDDDSTLPPPPGTPLSDILVYRDQPSSAGTEVELISHTDLTSRFDTGPVSHTLITGIEVGRETAEVTRYVNGIDVIPPTPLLDPNPNEAPALPLQVDTLPSTRGSDVSAYAMDRVHLAEAWDLDGGLRWDSFNSHFSEATTGSAFSRNDTELSPRAALVFNPTPSQSYYVSYGASYNPAIEYLTLAPTSTSLAPEKDYTTELGAKVEVLHKSLALTGALFDTLLTNARIADPDDPTVQQAPFDQRVLGLELGASGYVADGLEIKAGYSHLDDRISESTDPLASGKLTPNVPKDSASLWALWEPGRHWKLGGGPVYMGHRYADTYNTAGVPAYLLFNAMISYRPNDHVSLQANLNNLSDKLYFTSLYYSAADENHAVPGPGRTLLFTATVKY